MVDGYADVISCSHGDSITLYLNGKSVNKKHRISMTNLSGKEVAIFESVLFPQKISTENPYQVGFGYRPTARIKVPKLQSGVYLFDDQVPLVVKAPSTPQIVVVYSSNTDNAYCNAGGKSLYTYNSENEEKADVVSFLRPIDLPLHSEAFLRRFSSLKVDASVGYVSDMDLDEYSNLDGADLLIIPGHSEYWSREARMNFDRFIDGGGNALILSGNTMWWQIRYSEDGSQLICYKSFDNDPTLDTLMKTINWTKPVLQYPVMASIGLDFEHGGFGKKLDQGWDGFRIVNAETPLLKNFNLKENQLILVHSDEYDGAPLEFNADSTEVHLQNPHDFYRYELLGYDLASRKEHSNGAWIAMQKSVNSGMIINVGSTDWCAKAGMEGPDKELVKQLTAHMIQTLLKNDPSLVFSAQE